MTPAVTPRGVNTPAPFKGLPDKIGPYDLLRLIQDVGSRIGFGEADIGYLGYLITHTREADWKIGARPIVYKSVAKIARERDISERTVHLREQSLHRLGALDWNDIGNYRRSGMRDDGGNIVFAYGVDLSPLANLYPILIEAKKRRADDLKAFDAARRSLSAIRKRTRAKIDHAQANDLDVTEIAAQADAIRPIRADWPQQRIAAVLDLARGIEQRLNAILAEIQPPAPVAPTASAPAEPEPQNIEKTSDQSEENFRHIQTTNSLQPFKKGTSNKAREFDDRVKVSRFRSGEASTIGDVIERIKANQIQAAPRSIGIKHIDLKTAVSAASDDFKHLIRPSRYGVGIAEFVEAASALCSTLGISRSAWTDACGAMGRYGAAVAVLIIDRNQHHPDTPILSPGGAVRALTRRAAKGQLHLHKSLFGILDRDRGRQ